jgi:hypothetical protein
MAPESGAMNCEKLYIIIPIFINTKKIKTNAILKKATCQLIFYSPMFSFSHLFLLASISSLTSFKMVSKMSAIRLSCSDTLSISSNPCSNVYQPLNKNLERLHHRNFCNSKRHHLFLSRLFFFSLASSL